MGMYETIFILDSLLVPEEIDKSIENIKQMIDSNGGKVLSVDKWGKRRLAYEIQKKQYGFYVAIEFEGEGPIPNSLEQEYNFNDKILRYLTYRYTKNKIKAREKEVELKKSKPENLEIEQAEETTKKAAPPPEAETKAEEKVENTDKEPIDEEVENA
jgi:small subunit ribosomal protein S6